MLKFWSQCPKLLDQNSGDSILFLALQLQKTPVRPGRGAKRKYQSPVTPATATSKQDGEAGELRDSHSQKLVL